MATFYRFALVFSFALASSVGIAFADERLATAADEPMIMASLSEGVQVLDDNGASAVRGEAVTARATKYVMSSVMTLSAVSRKAADSGFKDTFVGGGTGSWTFSPLSWRYGYWGGSGWTAGFESPKTYDRYGVYVDSMDLLFRTHDNAYDDTKGFIDQKAIATADSNLKAGLGKLAITPDVYWGNIFVSSPKGAPATVKILRYSANIAVYKYMPFSEYARRQAVVAFTAKGAWNFAISGRR